MVARKGGKSELQRAGCRVIPGGGNPWKVPQKTDRLKATSLRVRVKRWGKSPPLQEVTPEGTANPTRSKVKQGDGWPARYYPG